MRRGSLLRDSVIVLAWSLALGAFPGTALADLVGPRPRHTCHVHDVAHPGETCFDCSTDYQSQERCLLEQQPLGRERRCIVRGDFSIDEVWCVPVASSTATSGTTSPATSSSSAPPPGPTSSGQSTSGSHGGCQIGTSAPPPLGGLVLLGALACATLRRAREQRARRMARGMSMGFLGLLASCSQRREGDPAVTTPPSTSSSKVTSLSEAQLQDLERQKQEIQKKLDDLQYGPLIDPPAWMPLDSVALGAFQVRLPKGWGQDSPPARGFAWVSPESGRHLPVELRLHPGNSRPEAETKLFRSLCEKEGPASAPDLTRLAALKLWEAPPNFQILRASVRRFGDVPALLIEGEYSAAKISRISVYVDAEEETDRPAHIDQLHLTLPTAARPRYAADIDQILTGLTLHREPRSRQCGDGLIGREERCQECCPGPSGDRRAGGFDKACFDGLAATGYDYRCMSGSGCAIYCLPSDPAKVRANIQDFKDRGKKPCKCEQGDPLCSCL